MAEGQMYWEIVNIHYGYIQLLLIMMTHVPLEEVQEGCINMRKIWNKLKYRVCTRGDKGCLREVR